MKTEMNEKQLLWMKTGIARFWFCSRRHFVFCRTPGI